MKKQRRKTRRASCGSCIWGVLICWVMSLLQPALAGEPFSPTGLAVKDGFVHSLGVEGRMGYLFPTSSFLKGANYKGTELTGSNALMLKYALRVKPGSEADRMFGGVYQGIGVGRFGLEGSRELGTPWAVYVFQGARLARFSPVLSLNYEWNFGVSFGWKPYDEVTNPANTTVGSKLNAYINAGFYLSWTPVPQWEVQAGVGGTHFSNGNTHYPNSGVNTADFRLGLVYHFVDPEQDARRASQARTQAMTDGRQDQAGDEAPQPARTFKRRLGYDLTLFGSWRRKAVNVEGGQIPAPGKYAVVGFGLAPMYSLHPKFRAGVSLDGVYDASCNLTARYGQGSTSEEDFEKPSLDKQLSLGFSLRGEWVMPFFSVGIGLGANVLHGGGDMKCFYQVLALKADLTKRLFLHVGYNLRNFRDPNYLMLGLGVHL